MLYLKQSDKDISKKFKKILYLEKKYKLFSRFQL